MLNISQEPSKEYLSHLLGGKVVGLSLLNGGRNSRTYKLVTSEGCNYIGKFYIGLTSEGKSRLEVEFSSLRFMETMGFTIVPKPIAIDVSHGCAIHGFLEGNLIDINNICDSDVDQMADFLKCLHIKRLMPEAKGITNASEACFSIESLMDNINLRLQRLILIRDESYESKQVHEFLSTEFKPALEEISSWCQRKLRYLGESISQVLAEDERTLSPSDYGFHNCLKGTDGRLLFYDFEYFGWDDPAKMVCDFILHPAMNLDITLKTRFLDRVIQNLDTNRSLKMRVERLYPFFGLKWCLILLNIFLPQYANPRYSADAQDRDLSLMRNQQLEKARLMLIKIRREYEHFPYWRPKYV